MSRLTPCDEDHPPTHVIVVAVSTQKPYKNYIYISVTTNQRLTDLKEELRLNNQNFAQLAQVLNMTINMIHYDYPVHTNCIL